MNESSGTIPKGWQKKQIKDLLDYERPDNYIVKSTNYNDREKTPVLTANKSFILGYTNEDFGVYENIPAIIFDDFTTDSKYVDFPFKVKSSAIKILKEKDSGIDLRFVYEKIKSINFPTGSHKRYYISQYQNMQIATPPLSEQRRIADVLSTVDDEINKTGEIIDATEKLKQGLMRKFFIQDNGLDTTLENIGEFKRGPFGGALKKEIFVADGYKVYEQKNAIYNDFSLGSYFIDKEKFQQMRGFAIKNGDILISCSGTLGKVAVVPEKFREGIINQALLKITISKEWDVFYVKYLLESEHVQSRFTKVAPGSAMKNMASMQTIKATKIKKPKLGEQQKVVGVLLSVDEKISINQKLKSKLVLLKKGLAQDLLSGKKRTI